MNDDLFILDPKQRDAAMGTKRYSNGLFPITTGFFLVAAILLVGLIIGRAGINNWNKYRLGEHSITTQATVVDTYTRSSDDSTSYYIVYEFRYAQPNGESAAQRSEIEVSRDVYRRIEDGTQTTVWYNPDDPTISTQRPPYSFLPSLIQLIIGAVGLIVIAPVVLFGYRLWMLKLHRLERDGQLIYGTLTRIKCDSDIDSKGNFSTDATHFTAALHYQFVSPQGREIKTRRYVTLAASRHDGNPVPPAGTPIAIWYADDNNHKVL